MALVLSAHGSIATASETEHNTRMPKGHPNHESPYEVDVVQKIDAIRQTLVSDAGELEKTWKSKTASLSQAETTATEDIVRRIKETLGDLKDILNDTNELDAYRKAHAENGGNGANDVPKNRIDEVWSTALGLIEEIRWQRQLIQRK